MSIQLFQRPRRALSGTLFPHDHVIGSTSGFAFISRPEWNHPRNHTELKTGNHPTAQSKVGCGREFVEALSWIAVLILLASTASAQRLKIEIRVLPDASGRVVVDGSYAPAAEWSFRDSYAGVLNLGSRIEGLRLFDAAGVEVSNRKIAPGQFKATAPATRFHYEAKLPTPARAADASRVSWLNSERGLLMLRDLLPARPAGAAANLDVTDAAVVRLMLPPGWAAYSNDYQDREGDFESSDADLTVLAVGRSLRATTGAASGIKLNVVLAGEGAFSDAEAVELASKILKAHHDVFTLTP